jgi:hypothetical protein
MSECDHPLDPEFVHPGDVDVLGIADDHDGVYFELALPCPECSTALEIHAPVGEVIEGEFELPLDDARYD